jgi:hypothetical protein
MCLRDQRSGGRKVTTPNGVHSHAAQQERKKLAECAGLTGELDLPYGHTPATEVPQNVVRSSGHPAPSEYVFWGDVWAGKDTRGLPQRRCGGGRAVGDQQREAIQQQVGRARRVRRRGQGPGCAGDIHQITSVRQLPGDHRGLPRLQIGLAGQAGVQRLEPPGRL